MIKAIFAVDYWGGMGNKGTLPWPHHTEDLQYFKEQTENQIVVMGRRTWDDPKMPKPLPNRYTCVVTHRPIIGYGVRSISGDIKEHLLNIEKSNPKKTIWIIGGPEILMSHRYMFDEVHVSHFKGQYHSDTQIDLKKFLTVFRAYSAKPSSDRLCNWTVYKNVDIFKSK